MAKENKLIYKRENKGEYPVLAICYDFDRTLSPNDMQAQGYIQHVFGDDTNAFWEESNNLAFENDMDQNLSWMYKMKDYARGKELFTKEKLMEYGANVKLYDGVSKWFERVNRYGVDNNVIVEHYIISSGLKEMIEGTEPAKSGFFKCVFASSFLFDERQEAIWPAQVVNYTNKTQFLFRIEKGVLNVNDSLVNDHFAPEEIRVPFSNIVYIGDSDTDIPCMRLVNSKGGYSVGVYDPTTKDKSKVYKMIADERISYYAPADYTENSELDDLIKKIIKRTSYSDQLERKYFTCKAEMNEDSFIRSLDDEESKQLDLIYKLGESMNFASTHTIISELKNYKIANNELRRRLCVATLENSQVYMILNDKDLHDFFIGVLADDASEEAGKVRKYIK